MHRSFELESERRPDPDADRKALYARRDVFPDEPQLSDAVVSSVLAYQLIENGLYREIDEARVVNKLLSFLHQTLSEKDEWDRCFVEIGRLHDILKSLASVSDKLGWGSAYEIEQDWLRYVRQQPFAAQVGRLWSEASQSVDVLAMNAQQFIEAVKESEDPYKAAFAYAEPKSRRSFAEEDEPPRRRQVSFTDAYEDSTGVASRSPSSPELDIDDDDDGQAFSGLFGDDDES